MCCRFLGSVSISARGKIRGRKAETSALGFERRQLAQMLREEASEQYPYRIAFEFDMKCLGGDLEAGKLTFQTSRSSELKTCRFDLLIGADGQNSRVRAILEDQVLCHFYTSSPRVLCMETCFQYSVRLVSLAQSGY
jgi:2-polyprenyl-6-methoxyphenol hydroxylase-like FAD-dependent oxidoreductase